MISTSNESQLQFVFQTFEKDFQLNINKITQLYNILYTILSVQIKGRSIRIDIIINLRKLTMLKKKMIVRKIFNLNLQRFPPRIYDVENIINRLLAIYDTIYIRLC